METNSDKIRKERILKFMRSKEYTPMKMKELCILFDVPKSQRNELAKILADLEAERKISVNRAGKYIAASRDGKTAAGVLSCSGRGFFGFIAQENGDDVFIRGEDMGTALDGDTVVAEVFDKRGYKNERREGRVVKITSRANTSLIGVITEKKNKLYKMKCDNEKIYAKIRIEPRNMAGAEIGDRVIIEITRYEGYYLFGTVKKILGKQSELISLTESIIYEHKIRTEFPKSVLEAAQKTPSEISPEDTVKRLDLRGKNIFTIDGDNSKDFDDAVSIEKTETGFILGVHIADVTHYVHEGEALDKEAFERGTSVYLADRVIPMLPERLSNGICSLNPNCDRLALSVIMNFDKDGNRLGYKIHKSVIRSCERMTYKNVSAILDGGNKELLKRYKSIVPDLKLMKRLSAKLEKQRERRGCIDFDMPEVIPLINERGEPVGVVSEERLVSHRMIESFMLAANEAVAEFASEKELPFIYRVHENLSPEKLAAVREFLQKLNIRLVGRIDENNPLRPKQLQSVLNRTKGTPEEKMVSIYLLRSMMKARYSPECSGHFGLAAEYYCHFTSPIRRYPDLAIHRILKEKLSGKIGKRRFAALTSFAAGASVKSSEKEIEAMYCEREVDDLMKTAYMSRFIGSEFTAKISSVTSFGIFAELENGIEGLIRLETMRSDYYTFDESVFRLIGERTGRIYNIGDTLEVVLVRADTESRQIDFVLKEDATKESIDRAARKASVKVSIDRLGRPKKSGEKRKSGGRRKSAKNKNYYNKKSKGKSGGKRRGH
ncbi:MAG: ribonuclease R [Oscillospiraceae bacterium]|nr:ribonuclease R [Oscillospiraceae bacterium]